MDLPQDLEVFLKSTLISAEMMAKYKFGAEKLQRDLENMNFGDHMWNLKSYDLNGTLVVKIHYRECLKEIGGGAGDYSKAAISNLFANFKKCHMQSTLHIKQWYKRKKIHYHDHPKKDGNRGKPLILITVDHKSLVQEGLSILHSMNDSVSEDDPPFVLVGDAEGEELK